jgi:hypothetical protein
MTNANTPVNAWIFLEEDDPAGSNYNTPGSSYQNAVVNGVYAYVDILSICWVNTVFNGPSYSIELQTSTHPGGSTNLDYMQWLIADARAANPAIKIIAMMGYGSNEITQLFTGPESGWQQVADQYAQNIVAYLQHYGLDGLDVDWEPAFSSDTSPAQFAMAFTAIGEAFQAQATPLILAMGPSTAENLDSGTVNAYFDFLSLQVYGGASPGSFTGIGIEKSLLYYGAKFEPDGGVPYQDAPGAYKAFVSGGYTGVTQWRLNSNDFQYEQAQQMILYQMVKGIPGPGFNDGPIVAAAGNPPIGTLVIRHGEVVDALQATNPGEFSGNPITYQLVQHGGNGGQATTVTVPSGDAIAAITGFTGVWFGWECVLQITVQMQSGLTFGPFGSMANASSQTPFTLAAPAGQSIVAFSGSIVTVPEAGGGNSAILASLDIVCA